MSSNRHILTCDLGGTNGRFGLFQQTTSGIEQIKTCRVPTSSADSFTHLLELAIQTGFPGENIPIERAVLAVAGPILGQRIQLTNIPWDLVLPEAEKALGCPCVAINDFTAQAAAWCSHIAPAADCIHRGVSDPTRPIAVVGAGTGLGKAILLAPGEQPLQQRILSSEGGHLPMAVADEEDFAFLRFAREKLGFQPLWDQIMCGPGISLMHEFLTGVQLSPADVASTFADDSPTLHMAARYYGRVCRDFVLDILALGGVALCGGVAAQNPILVRHPEFRQAFIDSRAHRQLLEQVPISLLTDSDSGLWGAATWGFALQEASP